MTSDIKVLEAVEAAYERVTKPEHFTNHLHCEECEEHDQTLLRHDRDTLKLHHVNNPGWDPLCFCTPHGKAYYLPCLVRFALSDSDYWQQLLFHLEGDGPNNALISYCTPQQRRAVAGFLYHLIETRAADVEMHNSTDELLRTYEHWTNAA